MAMKYADLDQILEELVKEGRITRLPSPTGNEMISLRADSRTEPGRGQSKELVAVLEITAYVSKTFSLRSSNIKAS